MLRIRKLSGEEVASVPFAELSDVKSLKQRLHQHHGLPPRFRQRLLHKGNTLDDADRLWVLVKALYLSYHTKETILNTIDPYNCGNLN